MFENCPLTRLSFWMINLALCFQFHISTGQVPAEEEDSLLQLIGSAEEDTNKVMLLLRLSKSCLPSDYDRAIHYARAAVDLAEKVSFPGGSMLAHADLGKLYKDVAEFDSALLFLEKSNRLADSLNEQSQLAKNYNEYGSLLRRKGYYSSALDYHRKSLQISMRNKDTLNMANAAVYLAMIMQDRLEDDTAINYYYTALRMYEALGNKRNIGVTYLNIGDLYYDLDDPGKAMDFYRRGLPLFIGANDLRLTGQSYNKIGTIHSYQGNYDSALYYYQKAGVFFDSIKNISGLAHLDINIGNVYANTGRYDLALPYYNKATEAFRKAGFQRGYQNALMALADMYVKQGRYREALDIYYQCVDIAKQVDLQALLKVYADLVDIYKTLGNSDKALECQELYMAVKDSVFQREKIQTIADTELKYEKEKDKARLLYLENEALEKDVALERRTFQRNTYLGGGLIALLILIFLFAYYSQRARKNRIIAEQRINQLEEEKKLLAARSIVEGQEEERKRIAKELHDGLGVLLSSAKMHFTSLRDKTPEAQPLLEKAAKLLEQASGDVRRISHNMMPGLLTRFGLFEAIQDLVEQVDDVGGIHAEVIIKGEQKRLKENMEIMLYRIIQEMVNNSLKHSGAANIKLEIEVHPDTIRFLYSDDGKGFDYAEIVRLKTMGLTNLFSRVKFLGGELKAETAPGEGVRYIFEIPV